MVAHNLEPYEQILKYIRSRRDIWITAQGEYISWWQKREKALLKIILTNGISEIYTSLENAVIEKFPGEFFTSSAINCPETNYNGEVWITIHENVEKKDLLVELLKREGILNFQIGSVGPFMLCQEKVGSLLAEIEAKLQRNEFLCEADVNAVRQLVINELARYNLPLWRIWYHPQVDGVIFQAVFSPRYDVDRAITNLAKIRRLEINYKASSTFYIRAFCPFYSDKEVRELAAKPWCSEIALHGEFVTNARHYGNEFEAAKAEKEHLEKLIGRSVNGVSMHGGELTYNRSENTANVIQNVELIYDTTAPFYYYFPFKKFVNGRLSKFYTLCNTMSDVRLLANQNYGRALYEQTIARMDKVYEQHGIFVLLLHPEYFGFISYLAQPKNILRLARFCWQYLMVNKLNHKSISSN
jgi:hypothetical protein